MYRGSGRSTRRPRCLRRNWKVQRAMRWDKCHGLPDAGQLDGVSGRRLRERIRHGGIDVQWLRHLRHTDAHSMRKQPVRDRWQWGLRRQLHVDLLRHRLLLQFHRFLCPEETQRSRQHVLRRHRVFIWPLLLRRDLLQLGLHGAMPKLQQQLRDLWPSHFGSTGRGSYSLCQRRHDLRGKLRRELGHGLPLSRNGASLRNRRLLCRLHLDAHAGLQWIRYVHIFYDERLWNQRLLQRW